MYQVDATSPPTPPQDNSNVGLNDPIPDGSDLIELHPDDTIMPDGDDPIVPHPDDTIIHPGLTIVPTPIEKITIPDDDEVLTNDDDDKLVGSGPRDYWMPFPEPEPNLTDEEFILLYIYYNYYYSDNDLFWDLFYYLYNPETSLADEIFPDGAPDARHGDTCVQPIP